MLRKRNKYLLILFTVCWLTDIQAQDSIVPVNKLNISIYHSSLISGNNFRAVPLDEYQYSYSPSFGFVSGLKTQSGSRFLIGMSYYYFRNEFQGYAYLKNSCENMMSYLRYDGQRQIHAILFDAGWETKVFGKRKRNRIRSMINMGYSFVQSKPASTSSLECWEINRIYQSGYGSVFMGSILFQREFKISKYYALKLNCGGIAQGSNFIYQICCLLGLEIEFKNGN